MSSTIKASGKIYNLGHRDISDLLNSDDIVIVQEKYDGSQFSFRWDEAGALHARSKGKVQYDDGEAGIGMVDKMFLPAVLHLLRIGPQSSHWVFRAETITKRKHNTLEYDRVPDGFLVLFGVESINEFGEVESFEDLNVINWGITLGTDIATQITALVGSEVTMDRIEGWLKQESSLGGPTIEGVVLKNFAKTDVRTGQPKMGKFVSEKFKETHKVAWKAKHPTIDGVVQQIHDALNTEARFEKTVQHLEEAGALTGELKDIGRLMQEVKRDILEEEIDYIANLALALLLPKVKRGLGSGLPEWYKRKLAEEGMAPKGLANVLDGLAALPGVKSIRPAGTAVGQNESV